MPTPAIDQVVLAVRELEAAAKTVDVAEGPRFAALVLEGPAAEERLVPASAGHGATLVWRRAR
jgi:hypothetical protein